MRSSAAWPRLNVETEVHDVAVRENVLLTLQAHLAGFLRALLATTRDELLEADHFSANKAFLKIGMNLAGGVVEGGEQRCRTVLLVPGAPACQTDDHIGEEGTDAAAIERHAGRCGQLAILNPLRRNGEPRGADYSF